MLQSLVHYHHNRKHADRKAGLALEQYLRAYVQSAEKKQNLAWHGLLKQSPSQLHIFNKATSPNPY